MTFPKLVTPKPASRKPFVLLTVGAIHQDILFIVENRIEVDAGRREIDFLDIGAGFFGAEFTLHTAILPFN